MTNERIDELLSELDEALSVQPSPAVAARVRTRIAERAGRRPVAVLRLTVAAALAAVAASGAAVWWQAEPAPMDLPRQTVTTPAASAPVRQTDSRPSRREPRVAAESSSATPAMRAQARPRAGLPARAADPPEPEVMVSPAMRLAFEQLQDAAQSGRLTAESFSQAEPTFDPVVVTPTVIRIRALKVEGLPLNLSGQGPGPDGLSGSQERMRVWQSRPPSRTRSSS